MPTVLSTLIHYPEYIQNVFVTKKVRQDGRYTFRFFKNDQWVPVVVDDQIPLEEDEVLFTRSPTARWWPLLLEKAYAKLYRTYEHVDGCNVVEVYYDFTGHPSLNVPMNVKLAKAAGAERSRRVPYWLHVGRRIASGELVAACLTVNNLEAVGMQSEQQYGVLDIFSRTGTSSVEDVVVHLYNPYEEEEYEYSGPLGPTDPLWTPAQRKKYQVDNPRSIFLPLPFFITSMNSLQLCYMSTLNEQASFSFPAEWRGETAGGNPKFSSWRHNPLFCVRNPAGHGIDVVMSIQQPDQRSEMPPDATPEYVQCGLIVVRHIYGDPIPTLFVTSNNHETVRRSLFLNSREVTDTVTIPANSLCYIVPCCMHKESEGAFTLRVTALKGADASGLTVERVVLPHLNYEDALVQHLLLREGERERVDFYVEDGTEVHILLRQDKPFTGPQGGDAVTEDFMGMYLYDEMNRRIDDVRNATNKREIGILHHLDGPGRFTLCVTCPRAEGEVPATVTIVTEKRAKAVAVEVNEDAYMFDESEIIDEGSTVDVTNPIDFFPVPRETYNFTEAPEEQEPFFDARFAG
ncbi:calpain-like cysteine peptidase, partial [Strigomonas culicis]